MACAGKCGRDDRLKSQLCRVRFSRTCTNQRSCPVSSIQPSMTALGRLRTKTWLNERFSAKEIRTTYGMGGAMRNGPRGFPKKLVLSGCLILCWLQRRALLSSGKASTRVLETPRLYNGPSIIHVFSKCPFLSPANVRTITLRSTRVARKTCCGAAERVVETIRLR